MRGRHLIFCFWSLICCSCTPSSTSGPSNPNHDPLEGRAPEVMGYLSKEKTACESAAQLLIRKGIDGHAQYAVVQNVAAESIGFLKGTISNGNADPAAVQKRLVDLQNASADFRDWAERRLPKEKNGEYGAVTIGGVLEVISKLAEIATELCKLGNELDKVKGEQEAKRRQELKDDLDKLQFKSWADLQAVTPRDPAKPTGALK